MRLDLLMFAGLAAFVSLGWWIDTAWRRRALLGAALVAWAAGLGSVALFHWQALPAVLLATALLLAVGIGGRYGPRHSSRGAGRHVYAGALLVLVLACAIPYYLYPMFELPAPDGPYQVGVRDFDITRRVVTGTGAPGEPRHLLVKVWYPAASAEEFARRRYFTRDEAMLLLPHFQFLHLYDVITNSHVGAPVRTGGARFPVVIFNHGYLFYPGQNTALMEELASHGYVVFSLTHPHDSATYRTLDGTLVEADPWAPSDELVAALKQFMGAGTYEERYRGYEPFRRVIVPDRLSRSVASWRDDNLFLVGALSSASPPAAVADIAASVDFNTLAYAGMSFGGGSAATTCQADPRCKAVVSLDGVTWDVAMLDTDLRAPLLLLQSDWLTHPLFPYEPHDPDVNPQDLAFERWAQAGERPDIYRYRVPESAHLGMTDLVLIARAPVRASAYGEIDGGRAIAAFNAFTLAFLNVYLRGEKTDFPTRVETEFPELARHRATGVRTWWLSRPALSSDAATGSGTR